MGFRDGPALAAHHPLGAASAGTQNRVVRYWCYLMTTGLVGEPEAFVTFNGGAEMKNS